MNALVTIRNGEARASSVDVAAAFEKAHRHVVRDIERLIDSLNNSASCNAPNFGHIEVRDSRNRPQRAYEMDRDGFSLLAMGFTGAKALEWKLKFLEAFRRMEEALSQSLAGNDNGLEKLHPLLQTAAGRDALWKGREQVRLMKELKGRDAAMALWIELGLPLPRNFDAILEHGAKASLMPIGEMHRWIGEHDVHANVAVATPWQRLHDDYFNWCFLKELTPYDQEKFRKHLRIHFGPGAEGAPGVFAIEIGTR